MQQKAFYLAWLQRFGLCWRRVTFSSLNALNCKSEQEPSFTGSNGKCFTWHCSNDFNVLRKEKCLRSTQEMQREFFQEWLFAPSCRFFRKCYVGRTQSSFLTRYLFWCGLFLLSKNTDKAFWKTYWTKENERWQGRKEFEEMHFNKKPDGDVSKMKRFLLPEDDEQPHFFV